MKREDGRSDKIEEEGNWQNSGEQTIQDRRGKEINVWREVKMRED
jgi:hypothetical protein